MWLRYGHRCTLQSHDTLAEDLMHLSKTGKSALVVGLGIVAAGLAFWLLRPRVPTATVAPGETLVEIATRHKISVADLVAWNRLSDGPLEPGRRLVLASPEGAAVGAATGAGGAPPFARPSPERCLQGPSLDQDFPVPGEDPGGEEMAMQGSQGLDMEQVQTAMGSFLPKLFVCVPSGVKPNGTIDLLIQVGCDGIVKSVSIEDDDGLDPRLVGCVKESLAYVDFPAHDMPDGFEFQYPMVFRW